MACWIEHYQSVLNQPMPITTYDFEQELTQSQLDANLEEITVTEMADALKHLKNNKVPGIYEIPADLLKHFSPSMIS